MLVSDISRERQDDLVSLSATYHWEDVDREPQRIFLRYGAHDSYFDDAALAMPFLIAAVVPALRRGEQRIRVEGGAVRPWLLDNLATFMAYLTDWYWYKYDRHPRDKRIPRLEADTFAARRPGAARTACFFSGGVDSLYSLRRNRANLPLDSQGSVKDALFVHGFDMGTRPNRGTEENFFHSVIASMRPVLDSEQLNLIPVFTNIRDLDRDTDCWLDEYMGSAMSAVAHGLAGKLTDVLVASSYEIRKLHPFSCHPMLEPRLSSYGLRVNHDGERLSRVERVRMVAQWPAALQSLRVCFFGDDSRLNCGKCPKCIRTKLELVCAGKLAEAVTLPGGEPSPQEVREGLVIQHDTEAFMDTLEAGLREKDRHDLADAVRAARRRYVVSHARNPKGLLKHLDEKLLRGVIKRRWAARGARIVEDNQGRQSTAARR